MAKIDAIFRDLEKELEPVVAQKNPHRIAASRNKPPKKENKQRSERHDQDVKFLHRLVGAKVVAEAMDCTTKNVYELVKAGKISYSRMGRRIGFDLAEVKIYLDSLKVPAAL